MNILYLEHYVGGPEYGMEFRPYYLAREWVKQGHEVHIIGATYSHLRRRQPKATVFISIGGEHRIIATRYCAS